MWRSTPGQLTSLLIILLPINRGNIKVTLNPFYKSGIHYHYNYNAIFYHPPFYGDTV